MCWNGEASVFFATVGMGAAIYSASKRQSPLLYIPLGYFALMEVLQALTYPVLNQCGQPQNQLLTYLSYLHIAFQPFFFNALGLYFIPPQARQKLWLPVGVICLASCLITVLRALPMPWLGGCPIGHIFCDTLTCSVSGSWHMEWHVALNNLLPSIPNYVLTVVALPFLYGAWKPALFSLLMGIGVSWTLSGSIDELPAVWCLFSVGLIMLMVYTPLQQHLTVHHWPLWPKGWNKT